MVKEYTSDEEFMEWLNENYSPISARYGKAIGGTQMTDIIPHIPYNEVTQALPIMGMRVMINPEKENNYNGNVRGQSGFIIDLQGGEDDAEIQIRKFSKGKPISWWVSVRFDNNEEISVRLEHMLKIHSDQTITKLLFSPHGNKIVATREADNVMDEYVIQKKRALRERTEYTYQKQEEFYEKAHLKDTLRF